MQIEDLKDKMINAHSWEEIKDSLNLGSKLIGVVTKHFSFGIFVALPGVKFTGLVQIPDFKDEGDMTPSEYPAVGSSVNVVVLGFKETGQQIWLGMKPSQLNQSQECGMRSLGTTNLVRHEAKSVKSVTGMWSAIAWENKLT